MRTTARIAVAMSLVCLLSACTSGVAVRNELAYPIIVFSVEPAGPGLSGTPIGWSLSSSSDIVHIPQPTDAMRTLKIQPGETGHVTFGGRMVSDTGRDVIRLYLTPAADTGGAVSPLAGWTNCAIGLSPPLAPMGVTLVIRRSPGASTLAIDAFDQVGTPVDGVVVGWNVTGMLRTVVGDGEGGAAVAGDGL